MKTGILSVTTSVLTLLIASCATSVEEAGEQVQINVETPRDEAFVDALNGALPHLLDLVDAPGLNIAVARGGEVIFEGAYGYADVHEKRPMQVDTVFRSGSMGKVYTGVAIMQLVERGVISLDDPINKYLPFEVKNPHGGDEVTIYHLMTHSSGLYGDGAGSVLSTPRPLEDSLRAKYSVETQPLWGGIPTWSYKAGEGRSYSNIGIATLGLIVQRANPDGLSFSDFVELNIMQPLGMESTQYPPVQNKSEVRPEIWDRMSTGYNTTGDVWLETPIVYFEEFPAGGFVSIPRDHVKLFIALMNGGELDGVRILTPESVEQMLTVRGPSPHPGYPDGERGLIWFLLDWDEPGARTFSHGGGHMFGWRTMAMAWPDHDTAIVYAFNEYSSSHVKSYYNLINEFVGALLSAELPARTAPDLNDIENLAWKASYLRGLIFAEGYRYGIGVPEEIEISLARRIAAEAKFSGEPDRYSLPWDEQAFVQGVEDMNGVEGTAEAIHSFAHSEDMKVDLGEAKRIAAAMDTGVYSSLAGLLNTPE
nr:serine hydrolase domain-containing protein [Hyphomonas sp. Mor2]